MTLENFTDTASFNQQSPIEAQGLNMVLQVKNEPAEAERTSSSQHFTPEFSQNYLERGPVEAEVSDGEHEWVWEDGSEYRGDWLDGKANGRGTFLWPSGRHCTVPSCHRVSQIFPSSMHTLILQDLGSILTALKCMEPNTYPTLGPRKPFTVATCFLQCSGYDT